MCCNFPTIKITEGNAFTLIFPLKRRSYVAERPIDEDIDVTRLSNVHVTLGGVEYAPTIETYGVRIDVPATLARGTYDGLLTAEYDGNAIRGAYESCVQIVAWNAQSNAQQYILGSPVATKAAYVLGYMPTDTEVEELKQQLREQIAAAKHAEAEAIAEKERYAEALEHLDDIAKQGDDPYVSLTSLSEIIERLDISQVAKQGSDSTATNTAIRDKVDEIIATIGGEADVNAVYLELLNRQTDYQAEGFPGQKDLPHLPQAVAAFNPRKISGVPEAADGISLVQLLHASAVYNTITELKDDTSGWTLGRTFQKSLFPNLTKLALGCKTANIPIVQDMPDLEHLDLPNLEGEFNIIISGENKVKELYLPNVGTCTVHINNGWAPITSTEIEELIIGITKLTSSYHHAIIRNCSTIKRLIAPRFVRGYYQSFFYDCPNLEYIYVPKSTTIANIGYDGNQLSNLAHLKTFIAGGLLHNQYVNNSWMSFDGCPNLIHLEVEGSITDSTNIMGYSPTMALRTDTDAEDYVDLREDMTLANNLQQFLQNFRDYIAERLTDNGSGLTLTLSQEVRNAIHAAEDEYGIENIIITQKGWTISPAPN